MQYFWQQHATGATSLSEQCKVHGEWKTKREVYCISTVIATNCTSSYKSYRMYQSHLHSLRWQWLIILRLYLYLLALKFGTLPYLAFETIMLPIRMSLFDATLKYILPHYAPILFSSSFTACKQISFIFESRATALFITRRTQTAKALKQTKRPKNKAKLLHQLQQEKHQRFDSKCQVLTYSSYWHQMLKNKIYRN